MHHGFGSCEDPCCQLDHEYQHDAWTAAYSHLRLECCLNLLDLCAQSLGYVVEILDRHVNLYFDSSILC